MERNKTGYRGSTTTKAEHRIRKCSNWLIPDINGICETKRGLHDYIQITLFWQTSTFSTASVYQGEPYFITESRVSSKSPKTVFPEDTVQILNTTNVTYYYTFNLENPTPLSIRGMRGLPQVTSHEFHDFLPLPLLSQVVTFLRPPHLVQRHIFCNFTPTNY